VVRFGKKVKARWKASEEKNDIKRICRKNKKNKIVIFQYLQKQFR
jgi:hypothetical protein